jgi:hypothetical protein
VNRNEETPLKTPKKIMSDETPLQEDRNKLNSYLQNSNHYHAISVAFNRNMHYTMTSPCAEQIIQGIGLESNSIHEPG